MGLQMGSYPDAGFQQRIEDGVKMEFYSYVNIYETKGLTYLLVLSFLVIFVLLIKYISVPEKKDPKATDRKPVV
jgi:hypothetical protein